MGLLRETIGTALGNGQVNNGFNSKLNLRKSALVKPDSGVNRSSPPPRQYPFSRDQPYASLAEFSREEMLLQNRKHNSALDHYRPAESEYMDDHRYHKQEEEQFREQRSGKARVGVASHQTQQFPESDPPPYEPHQKFRNSSSSHPASYGHEDVYASRSQCPMEREGSPFRPLLLPQIAYGKGPPFLRGYSDELQRYGILDSDFIQVLDEINLASVPNPEAQIFQKAANIAGWFIPGSAAIGLMAGQVSVGVGTAIGHASRLAQVLMNANLEILVPKGLEICIGNTINADTEAGLSTSSQTRIPGETVSPEARLMLYGHRAAPLSKILPPSLRAGRIDPLAVLGRSIEQRSTQKKFGKAQEGLAKGKSKDWNALEKELKWIIVRQVTPEAVDYWRRYQIQMNTPSAQE